MRHIVHKLSANGLNLHKFFSTKKIYQKQDCRYIIKNTTQKVSNIASITFGPLGRNVLIENQMRQQPRITKDGVTVVKHLEFQDNFQNAVTTLIKKSVEGTNKFAGDGTTSSTIMIGELVKIAIRKIAVGQSIRQIKEGLKIGRQISLDYLNAVKRDINKQQDLQKIALISTNGNQKLSKLISEAIWSSANVNVQKSNTKESYIQYFSGLKIVRGVPHPQFKNVGDHIVYNYPLVFTSKVPLDSTKQIINILQMAKKARKQLIIFAQKVDNNILSTLIYNKRKNILQACALQVPPYGDAGSKYIDSIAKATGSFVFDRFTKRVEDVSWDDLGKAVRITIDQFQTEIRGKTNLEEVSATIYAGGSTETVSMQNYDKIIDALNSVTTAKKNGIVAGAGLTYWNLGQLLEEYSGQSQIGVKILAQALKTPRKKLFSTIQLQNKPLESEVWVGYNLKTRKMQDMFQSGIIDSVQVCKNVIIDSISLAGILIDVEAALINSQKHHYTQKQYQELAKGFKM